jgi:uncharacterized protein
MPVRLKKVLETVISFSLIIAVVYCGLIGALYLFQRNLLYHPSTSMPSPSESGVPEMSVVTLDTSDGFALKSWYVEPRSDNPTIIYFCGNAGHIGFRADKAHAFMEAGFGVLLLSYRGFGGNPGKPTEDGLYEDARAAIRFIEHLGVSNDRMVLFGESLGTGIAVRIASEIASVQPIAALVLETPYTSIADVAASHYPFAPARWLLKDRFDALSRIASIGSPVLMIHAEDDPVIPINLAKRLYAAAVNPKEASWFEFGGHEGLFELGAEGIVIDFIVRSTH